MYDAIVIGGGPGGSSTAGFLARAGRRVLVLEKDLFPRFHIGESLLPYNRQVFEDLGVLPELERAGYLRKFGAQFHLGNGVKSTKFVFREGRYTREPQAFQVERAAFDDLLLRHARKCGAEVREGWTVGRFRATPEGVEVDATPRAAAAGTEDGTTDSAAQSGNGKTETLRARWLIDASGRGNLTGNQEGLREPNPRLQKLAVFGHFEGVRLDDGPSGGDTVIVRMGRRWFWIIPLTRDRVSVGLVIDKSEVQDCGVSPEEMFDRLSKESPVMRERMGWAQRLMPMQVTTDFSYTNRRLVGERLLRVGDAAGFMDPIFSAGVYLAMSSGRRAAEVVDAALREPARASALSLAYEQRVRDSMRFYWEMVEAFYSKGFMEVFLQPRHRFSLPAAVNAVLAGELEGGWSMRWRLRVFFWIVRLQARWPLVPRLEGA